MEWWNPDTGEMEEVEDPKGAKPALWIKPETPLPSKQVKFAPVSVPKPQSRLTTRHAFSTEESRLGGQSGKGKKKNVDPEVAKERARTAALARYK